MNAKPLPAVIRPASCHSDIAADHWICDRCGAAGLIPGAGPDCKAMTVARIRAALDREIEALQQSADLVLIMRSKGALPADPLPALMRVAELRGVRRLLDRVLTDDRILDLLNPNRRKQSPHG